jgi:hypothetical protein
MVAIRTDSLEAMRTLVLDPSSAGLDELFARRRRSGLDRIDEIWEGVYHMVPAPSYTHGSVESQLHAILRPLALQVGLEVIGQSNLGEGEHDFRVPDLSLHRPGARGVWHPTAALVVEIASPNDESWEKLPFYAAHSVDEALIVDPQRQTVSWLALDNDSYSPVARSRLVDLGAAELSETIECPDEAASEPPRHRE